MSNDQILGCVTDSNKYYSTIFKIFEIILWYGIISRVLGKDGFYFKVALLRNRTPSPGQDRVPWKSTSPPLHGHPPSAGLRLPTGKGLSEESTRSTSFCGISLHQRGRLWFGLPQAEAGFYRAADGRLKRVLVFDLFPEW